MRKRTIYEKLIKRPFDFWVALLAFILLSPVILILCIFVRFKLGSPILFKQDRPGLNEEIFTLYKFRTMSDEKNECGEMLSDELRLTKFGKFLRSTSLDELPSLFNIIKGNMSFVGPRPLLVEYLDLYAGHHKKRHTVRPGLTGLAQVNGRNALTWEEKFDLDLKYIENIRITTDLKIILMTLLIVIKRDGISSSTSVTMEKFQGKRDIDKG